MALEAQSTAVTSSATPISAPQTVGSPSRIIVRNDGAVDVFVGPAGVTATGTKQGLRVPKESTMPVPITLATREEVLFAITASGESVVQALRA